MNPVPKQPRILRYSPWTLSIAEMSLSCGRVNLRREARVSKPVAALDMAAAASLQEGLRTRWWSIGWFNRRAEDVVAGVDSGRARCNLSLHDGRLRSSARGRASRWGEEFLTVVDLASAQLHLPVLLLCLLVLQVVMSRTWIGDAVGTSLQRAFIVLEVVATQRGLLGSVWRQLLLPYGLSPRSAMRARKLRLGGRDLNPTFSCHIFTVLNSAVTEIYIAVHDE